MEGTDTASRSCRPAVSERRPGCLHPDPNSQGLQPIHDVSETTSQAASAESSDSPMSEHSSAVDERGRTEETEGNKTTAAVQSMPATALMAVSGTPTSVGQTVYGTLSVELPPPLASTQWLEGRTTYAVVIDSSDLALLTDYLSATGSRVTVSHAEEGQNASVEAIVRALATYPR